MDILFLAHRSPFPPDRGDRIRSYHVLRHLAAGARVHLVAFADTAAEAVVPPDLLAFVASARIVHRRKPRGQALAEALLRREPLSLAAFRDARIVEAVADVLASEPIAAIYCFSGQMAQYLPASGPKMLMDFVDADSAKFDQLAERSRAPQRWLLRREARLLAAFERATSTRVDTSLFVTDAEAALFRRRGGEGRIATIENGLDAQFYDPAAVAPVDEAGPLIVFTGQMDYAPNVEAASWFATEALSAIRAAQPTARFAIVGRRPTASVRALAGEAVIVTGEVADARPWLAAASVCVAPLRLARGVQNKVLEAMAMARPVVATPEAAKGIDHAGTIRVAAHGDFAGAVIEALAAPGPESRARKRILERYDWPARLAPLDTLLGAA